MSLLHRLQLGTPLVAQPGEGVGASGREGTAGRQEDERWRLTLDPGQPLVAGALVEPWQRAEQAAVYGCDGR